jgi:hypothetical protein
MSERLEEELMEDLGYEEAEGAAEMAEEGEEFEDYAAGEAEFGAEEEWEAGEEDLYEDAAQEEEFEEFEDYGEEAFEAEGEDSFEEGMAYALGAEDTDEFFRRLRRVAGRIGRTVGRVARVAAPIARLIPHPYAQIAARGLGLLGRLRAEGASEEEAMDAFAELAAHDESVRPILAGLAARTIVRGRGARLPMPVRRILVRGMGAAARTLTQRRGPVAIRALPRIVRSVARTAAVRRTPLRVVPRIVRRTAARVAGSRRLIRRLAQPSPTAVRRARPVMAARGVPRAFTLRGPVRISITSGA